MSRNGILELKKEYNQSISEKLKEDQTVLIPLENFIDTLQKLAKSETKQADNTAVTLELKHSRCILSYNGEGWSDVHPIVKEILKDRNLL